MRLRDGTTMVLRLLHLHNLEVCLKRGALHAARHAPNDDLVWLDTHRADVQEKRDGKRVTVGTGGTLLDYVPFHFGPRSPMPYQLHTGYVPGFTGGQEELVYVVASAESIVEAGHAIVVFDGHALSSLSRSCHDLSALPSLDWETIAAERWNNTSDDPDRQRRKQAEFLVHRALPWSLVRGVVVLNALVENRVRGLYSSVGCVHQPEVVVRPHWYY
ncbi:MAG: DUF4433 domain-containing protein [Deltaproteobacteria bacterium]|nr:MAG: DUF4433 domain-containing protein [Deltaproteobacteria bacterium]